MHAIAFALLVLAAEPKSSPTKSSANSLYAIHFEQVDEKTCRVVVMKDRDPAWRLDRCLATVDDLLFINNDGSKFWVLKILPELPEPPAVRDTPVKTKADPMYETVVATEYDKEGKVLQSRKLKDFLEYKRRGLIRKLEKHFKWVQGVLDVPGKSPRVSDAEVLELEPVSGKTQQLKF
ncbi:MAG TPA: hypothetical protein VFA20_13115 [Myxococcaceae bacterium]|nr:hypothetical protein [Myxococcaceae bacterium]